MNNCIIIAPKHNAHKPSNVFRGTVCYWIRFRKLHSIRFNNTTQLLLLLLLTRTRRRWFSHDCCCWLFNMCWRHTAIIYILIWLFINQELNTVQMIQIMIIEITQVRNHQNTDDWQMKEKHDISVSLFILDQLGIRMKHFLHNLPVHFLFVLNCLKIRKTSMVLWNTCVNL